MNNNKIKKIDKSFKPFKKLEYKDTVFIKTNNEKVIIKSTLEKSEFKLEIDETSYKTRKAGNIIKNKNSFANRYGEDLII